MRQRIEDLGRLAVMLEDILENSLFERGVLRRDLEGVTDESMDKLTCALEYLRDRIELCLEISRGEDPLNEEELPFYRDRQ